jgi:beta-xylosidase
VFQNPVFSDVGVPDPFVLDDRRGPSGAYWAFSTGNLFPVLRSTDLVHWTPAGTAFAARPAWATDAPDWHPWAPSVVRTPGGSGYVMYYVSLSRVWGANCIGVATASVPGGPYADEGPLRFAHAGPTDVPIGCGDAAGRGNIDPSPFIDSDGSAYLYVSTDRIIKRWSRRLKPTISVIPLTGDLLHAAGARIALFSGASGTWEAADAAVPTVEGPAMAKHNGTYYLMYSGGGWRGSYGMGYAISSSPVSGFVKQPRRLLVETSAVLGPGGGDALVTGPHGETWLAYHGREGSYDQPRTLRLDRLRWEPGSPDVPVVDGPSSTPVPIDP